MKKILSFILSMMIVCNIFFGLNSKSYAATLEGGTVEVSTADEFREAINNINTMNDAPNKIILKNDITTDGIYEVKKDTFIDLNNHTLISSLNLGNTIKTSKLEIYNGILKGNVSRKAVSVASGSILKAKNVSFIGGSTSGSGGYGISNLGQVDLESCIVRSGDSSESNYALSAFNGDDENGGGRIKDCVFIRGTGKVSYSYLAFKGNYSNSDAYKDGNGNPIKNSDEDQNTFIVGSAEGIRGQSFDVKGTYVKSEGEVIYSVDVKWGNMTFEYNKGGKGNWDPKTHSYLEAGVSSWNYKESNTVEITNHSNSQINVKLSGKPEADKFKGASSFVFYSDEALNSPAQDKTIESAVDKGKDDEALKYKAFLKINGEMNPSAEETKIGSVTVAIGN